MDEEDQDVWDEIRLQNWQTYLKRYASALNNQRQYILQHAEDDDVVALSLILAEAEARMLRLRARTRVMREPT